MHKMVATVVLVTKILSLLILASSMFFNSVGIYLLNKTKNFGPGQIIIIINLSASELFIAVGYIIQDAFTLKGNDYTIYFNKTFAHIVWGMRSGFYTVWYLVMFTLTIDRFLACNFPLKHRKVATRPKIRTTMMIVWAVGLTNGVILSTNFHLFYNAYTKFVWLALDAVLLLIITVTYLTIFIRRFQGRRSSVFKNMNNTALQSRRLTMHQQFVKVVGLIVVTFVLFEVAPTTAFLILFKMTSNGSEVALSIILLCYNLVILSDPLIYIFLQDRIRKRLINGARALARCTFSLCKIKQNEVGVSSVATVHVKRVTFGPVKEITN